tara:strand:- start:92 stop:1015 length:924 start_codon:yes stop_codon:yes gene_type:complete
MKYHFKEFEFEDSKHRRLLDSLVLTLENSANLSFFWWQLTLLEDNEDPNLLIEIIEKTLEKIDFDVIENIDFDIYGLSKSKIEIKNTKLKIQNKLSKFRSEKISENLTSDDIYNVGEKIFHNVHSLVMNLFSTYATNSFTRYEKYYELDYQNEELRRIEKLEVQTLVESAAVSEANAWIRNYKTEEEKRSKLSDEINVNFHRTGILQTNAMKNIFDIWNEIQKLNSKENSKEMIEKYKELERKIIQVLDEDTWTALNQKEQMKEMLKTINETQKNLKIIDQHNNFNANIGPALVAAFFVIVFIFIIF